MTGFFFAVCSGPSRLIMNGAQYFNLFSEFGVIFGKSSFILSELNRGSESTNRAYSGLTTIHANLPVGRVTRPMPFSRSVSYSAGSTPGSFRRMGWVGNLVILTPLLPSGRNEWPTSYLAGHTVE